MGPSSAIDDCPTPAAAQGRARSMTFRSSSARTNLSTSRQPSPAIQRTCNAQNGRASGRPNQHDALGAPSSRPIRKFAQLAPRTAVNLDDIPHQFDETRRLLRESLFRIVRVRTASLPVLATPHYARLCCTACDRSIHTPCSSKDSVPRSSQQCLAQQLCRSVMLNTRPDGLPTPMARALLEWATWPARCGSHPKE